MHECPSQDRDQKPIGKKVLLATVELDDEGSQDCLSEFYFMTIKEEREEDFERVFEKLYVETICMVKKSKEYKEQLEVISKEKDVLEEKFRKKEVELTQSKEREEELQHQLANQEKDLNKMLRGSHFYLKRALYAR